jgi:hypothetical protein
MARMKNNKIKAHWNNTFENFVLYISHQYLSDIIYDSGKWPFPLFTIKSRSTT